MPLLDITVDPSSQLLLIPFTSQSIQEANVLEKDDTIAFTAVAPQLEGWLEAISKYASFDDYRQPINCHLAVKGDEDQ